VVSEKQTDKQRLIGSWRHIGTRIDGKADGARGHSPKGIIIYDVHGHMACHVAPDREIAKAGKEPTPDEAKAALADHIAYFGTYSVDERACTVTHHKQGSVQPGDKGDVVRRYEFAGDTLILCPAGTTGHEIIWQRIK
jgi:hypothetical protein